MTATFVRDWRALTMIPLALLSLTTVAIAIFLHGRANPVDAQQAQPSPSTPPPGVEPVPAEPWPPFVMVYRETSPMFGKNGAVGYQVAKVDYNGRRNFKVTILEHSSFPESVGMSSSYDGTTTLHHHPRYGDRRTTLPAGTKGDNTAAPWLVPGVLRYASSEPGAVVTRVAGNQSMVRRDNIAQGKQIRRETTFRDGDFIPTKAVTLIDGKEAYRAEVVELNFK